MKVPDRWIVVEIKNGPESIQKVLASWHGGYPQGDSWLLNSGIAEVKDRGEYYDFVGYSGSLYRCYKKLYGVSRMIAEVYSTFKKQETDTLTIDVVEHYEEECVRKGGSD